MSNIYWKHPGTLNGRIAPRYADAQDLNSDQSGVYYYGSWYHYRYWANNYHSYQNTYTYETGHVFALGEDSDHHPEYRMYPADYSQVSQANVDLTGVDVIYFTWLLDTSEDMPSPLTILTNGTCTFINGAGLVLRADAGDEPPLPAGQTDGMAGIELASGATTLFNDDRLRDRIITVAGATDPLNNGTFRVSAVPADQGRICAVPDVTKNEVINGRVALIENDLLAPGTNNAVTITAPGFRWVARAYVDAIQRCELTERAGRAWQRNNLAMHVSKLAGMHSISFELTLETVAA